MAIVQLIYIGFPDFEKVWLNLFDNRSSLYGKKLNSESTKELQERKF